MRSGRNSCSFHTVSFTLLAALISAVTPVRAGVGIWIAPSDLAQLPTSGAAWANLLEEANLATGTPNLADQDSPVDVRVMAKALVFARTGTDSYRQDVVAAIQTVTYGNTESGGTELSLCRGLVAYVIAADLVGLPAQLDADFRAFLIRVRTEDLGGSNMIATHEKRPNNWGLHCSDSRAAVARYLGDATELERVVKIFKGWLGDRSSYASFVYGADLSWQANPALPVGVNPSGATKDGHDIDGVLPDDQRRAGAFAWPPPKTVYSWGALGPVMATAIILDRAGHTDVWEWQGQAIRRAVDWLYRTTFNDGANYSAEGDDTWQPYVVNYYYGTSYPVIVPSRPGKNVGWTDWTHAGVRSIATPPTPANLRRADRASSGP